MVFPLIISAAGVALSASAGRRARKSAMAAAEAERRRLAIDADRQQKQLLEEAAQDNIDRLMAFERDAISRRAAEIGRKQALAAEGPELSLSREEAFTRAARARRRESFFSL